MFSLPAKLRRTGLLLLCFLVLSGCFEYFQEMTIESDGSGRAVVKYAASKGLAQSVMASQSGTVLMDEAAVREHFGDRDGLRLDKVDVWEREGNVYTRIALAFDHVTDLNDDAIQYEWTVEGRYRVLRMTLIRRKHRIKPGRVQSQIAEAMTDQGFHFKVHFPRQVIDSNAERVDWSVAEWFVPIGFFLDPEPKQKVLYAKFEATMWERVRGWFYDLVRR